MTAQVEGVVTESRIQFRPRRQLVVRIADDSGDLVHALPALLPVAAEVARGRPARARARRGARRLLRPRDGPPGRSGSSTTDTPLPTALTPVYPSTVQLSQAVLRKAVAAGRARADLDEHLPAGIVPPGLPTLRQALDHLHEPAPGLDAAALEDRSHPAWQRLKFEELLAQQLSQLLAQARARSGSARRRWPRARGALHERFLAALPFALTRAQRRVAAEIDADLARAVPMHRLLQGDVGSGKTVVAALAAARAIDAGWQCALMAPTEILAEQHLKKLVGWLAPLGVTVAWLTGSRKGKKRDEMLAQVASGEAGLVVGTHAVIEEQVRFAQLGLAIIDEQHRFGVAQRLALREKLHAGFLPCGEGERAGPSCPGGDGDRASARAASADDERDADPAHAGDDALRRPRRQHDRRAAARAHAGRHQALRRHAPRRGDRAHPRRGRARPADVLGLPAGRRVGGARPARTRPRRTPSSARPCPAR